MAPVAAIIIDPAMVFLSIVQFLLLGKIIVRATKREQSEELPILWFAHVYHSPCVEMMREEKYGKIKEESWDQVNEASNAVHSACGLPAVRLLCGWSHVTLGIAAPRVKQTVLISQVLFLKTKTELGEGLVQSGHFQQTYTYRTWRLVGCSAALSQLLLIQTSVFSFSFHLL